jgi:hypothetical protein
MIVLRDPNTVSSITDPDIGHFYQVMQSYPCFPLPGFVAYGAPFEIKAAIMLQSKSVNKSAASIYIAT